VRLLLDENLSESVIPTILDLYPESLHIRLLGAGGAADGIVWQLAIQHECLLVTRDEDFLRLSIMRGAPPKVVWLAVGNRSNQDIVNLLRMRHQEIHDFSRHELATVLTLSF
jgi:predicted nuclease of predicted toxin-antitoxin system